MQQQQRIKKHMDSDEQRKLAKAYSGKSARACDNCVRRRARWYCAADDAFLCQSCDSSVHSANPLARRHHRLRLKSSATTTSSIANDDDADNNRNISTLQPISVPSWHQGFQRKPRTPRQKKHGKVFSDYTPLHLVPEICSEEGFSQEDENEEQLLYRVPVFEPLVAELCTNESGPSKTTRVIHHKDQESKRDMQFDDNHEMCNLEGIALPSEILDLDGFAADVESLLGKGLEDEPFDIQGLGLNLHCDIEDQSSKECFNNWSSSGRVKVEQVAMGGEDIDQEINHGIGVEFDMGRDTFELNFDYEYSPITREEGEDDQHYQARKIEDQVFINNLHEDCKVVDDDCIGKTFLKLDYEGIMSAWDEERSPWMNGERPEFNSGGIWPDCLGTSGTMHALYGEMGMKSAALGDGAREARVSRYREKRRTRLFSKKIRYEVRKLNAEKRPRMKGRFVKRSSNFGASSSPTASAFPLLR